MDIENKKDNNYNFAGDVEFKKVFLEHIERDFSNSTFKQYIMIFNKGKDLEEEFSKDIYDFTLNEMKAFLKTFRAKTYNAISSRYSLIKKYIDYAKNKNLGDSNISVDVLLTPADIKEAISTTGLENRYCTRRELEEAISVLINPSDKAMFMLLFEGVMGKGYSDLLNLKIEQIDLTNSQITIENKEEDYKRVIDISNLTKIILEATIKEDTYYKYIENVDNHIGNVSYLLNMDSPYLLKKKVTKTTSSLEPLKRSGIKTRLDNLKDFIGKPLLTGRTIYISGVAERIVKAELKAGEQFMVEGIKEFLANNHETIEVGDMNRILKLMREKILNEIY